MLDTAAQIRNNLRSANVRAVLEDISFDEAAARNAAENGQHRAIRVALAVTCLLLGMSTVLHYMR